MSNDNAALFWAYRCKPNDRPTIHWAGCPYCRHGKGIHPNRARDGWTEMHVSEEQVTLMVQRETHRFCLYCCVDLK